MLYWAVWLKPCHVTNSPRVSGVEHNSYFSGKNLWHLGLNSRYTKGSRLVEASPPQYVTSGSSTPGRWVVMAFKSRAQEFHVIPFSASLLNGIIPRHCPFTQLGFIVERVVFGVASGFLRGPESLAHDAWSTGIITAKVPVPEEAAQPSGKGGKVTKDKGNNTCQDSEER